MSTLNSTSPAQMPTQQQQDLLTHARAGSKQARDEFLLSLQPRLNALALRFLRQPTRWQEHLVEPMDLVNTANVALLRWFSRALAHEDPIAYLLTAARTAMIDCLSGKHSFIKTPSYQRPYSVVSLDIYFEEVDHLLADNLSLEEIYQDRAVSPTQKYAELYRAIESLPRRQREVILRRYGLYGHSPESVYAIGRSFSSQKETSRPSQRPRNAGYYSQRALLALRQALTPDVPQSELYPPSEKQNEQ